MVVCGGVLLQAREGEGLLGRVLRAGRRRRDPAALLGLLALLPLAERLLRPGDPRHPLHQLLHLLELLDQLSDLSRRSDEPTSELQSLMRISYAVLCLKKTSLIHILKNNTIT